MVPGGATVEGFDSDNGPQLMLIQLLPSSTVAAGVRLKRGFGTVASEIPGGTFQPEAPDPGIPGNPCDHRVSRCEGGASAVVVRAGVAAHADIPEAGVVRAGPGRLL